MRGTFSTILPVVATMVSVVAIVTAIFWWLISREATRLERKERFLKQHCFACGYDLRVGHDVCPECGAPIIATDLPLTTTLNTALLNHEMPPSKRMLRKPAAHEARVLIYASENDFMVSLLAEYLIGLGIEVELARGEQTLVPNGLTSTRRQAYRVMVWSGDVVETTRVIRQFSRASAASGNLV